MKKKASRLLSLFLVITMTVGIFPVTVFAADENMENGTFVSNDKRITINAGEDTSTDTNGYMTLQTEQETDEVWGETVWNNIIEYDGDSNENGCSKLSFKIDKDYIGQDDTYYDITIEYWNYGRGIILLQTSTDLNNTPAWRNYASFVEMDWWSWWSDFYTKNISASLTNTSEWKKHTFRVEKDYFEKGIDNYIHFYFGDYTYRDWAPSVKVKSVSIDKRNFKIDSIADNYTEKAFGNIFTAEDFSLGFKVTNTQNVSQNIEVSYEIFDSKGDRVIWNEYDVVTLESGESQEYYVDEPEFYGTYKLIPKVVYGAEGEMYEKEIIQFSKIVEDLSNENNEFLGLNTIFGYGSYADLEDVEKTVELAKKLGINTIRTGINGMFITSDAENPDWYNYSPVGRYGVTFNALTGEYDQELLMNVWFYDFEGYNTGEVGNTLTATQFNNLKERAIELFVLLAETYGDEVTYYQLGVEWNLETQGFLLQPEQVAQLNIETAAAIKSIDTDAKIISGSSNRVPIYANEDYTTWSDDSWWGRLLSTRVDMDEDEIEETGICDVVDAFAVHPYTYGTNTAPEIDSLDDPGCMVVAINRAMKDFRELIESHTDRDIAIWLTEFGWQTSNVGATREQQAAYTIRELILSQANNSVDTCNIGKVFIWDLQDLGRTETDIEANYGICESYKSGSSKAFTRDIDMAAKEAYVAIDMYSYMLNGATLIESNEGTADTDGHYWYKFKTSDETKNIIVTWTLDEVGDKEVTFDVPKCNITSYDIYGNIIDATFENVDETFDFNVSYMPSYLVFENIQSEEQGKIDVDAPTITNADIESKTSTTITIKQDASYEYSKDSGDTWQASNEFTGLTANTAYNICVRIKETEATNASEKSNILVVKTEKKTELGSEKEIKIIEYTVFISPLKVLIQNFRIKPPVTKI